MVACQEALAGAVPFDGDEEKANSFLWAWDNFLLAGFAVAGLLLLDEVRAERGECSIMQEWASKNGVRTYRTMKADGKEILLDDHGRSLGVVRRKRPRHIKAVM